MAMAMAKKKLRKQNLKIKEMERVRMKMRTKIKKMLRRIRDCTLWTYRTLSKTRSFKLFSANLAKSRRLRYPWGKAARARPWVLPSSISWKLKEQSQHLPILINSITKVESCTSCPQRTSHHKKKKSLSLTEKEMISKSMTKRKEMSLKMKRKRYWRLILMTRPTGTTSTWIKTQWLNPWRKNSVSTKTRCLIALIPT